MFVEDGVQIVVVKSTMEFVDLRLQLNIGVVDALGVIILLPELDWPRVRGDKRRTAQQRHQRRVEQCRCQTLHDENS